MKAILAFVPLALPLLAQCQLYEGSVKSIGVYNINGETRQYYTNIWYVPSEEIYLQEEGKMYDMRNIAYEKDSFYVVISPDEKQILNDLEVKVGVLHGYYYPKGSRMQKSEIEDAYMAYIAVNMDIYHIHVDFTGLLKRYKYNYDLKTRRKNKNLVFFRIPSGAFRIDDESKFQITVVPNEMFLTITANYNRQVLILTLYPKEDIYHRTMRKLGFYNEPLITIDRKNKELKDSMP